MNESIIELKNICKSYDGGKNVLNDLSLCIEKGEFVTILGPSGCGKTTTLRMIGGFDTPDKGEVLFDGENITKLSPNKRRINTVFQNYALFPHMNVGENVAFGLKIKGVNKLEIKEKVSKILALVSLENFEKRSIGSLSGGQQQRVALARALVNEPEILLLDEPLGALDLKFRKEMQDELKKMHEKLGITFIYVTHDQDEALTMSDRIIVMDNGVIQQFGTPEEIYNNPVNVFVASFIGESNLFEGIIRNEGVLEFCGVKYDCDDTLSKDTVVDVMVRPGDIELVEAEEIDNIVKVESVIFKGTHYELLVEASGHRFSVYSKKLIENTERLCIYIPPEKIHIMKHMEKGAL